VTSVTILNLTGSVLGFVWELQASDGKNLANTQCLPEIETRVNIRENKNKNLGDATYHCGGSGRCLSTEYTCIVLRRFRNPSTGCGCHLSLTPCLLSDLCYWRIDHPPRRLRFEIKTVHMGYFVLRGQAHGKCLQI
jgi:hypothetical protein